MRNRMTATDAANDVFLLARIPEQVFPFDRE